MLGKERKLNKKEIKSFVKLLNKIESRIARQTDRFDSREFDSLNERSPIERAGVHSAKGNASVS